MATAACIGAINQDFRTGRVVGDQASHLMQMLSLAYDGDLRYEAEDLARWRSLGWAPTPRGLIYREGANGAVFAKPYLYSALAAPFIRLARPRFGVAAINCVIFLGLLVVLRAIARLRFDRDTAALLVIAFVFASNAYFYLYVIHPDLFDALLSAVFCYLVLRHVQSPDKRWLFGVALLFGISISEKISILCLFAPVFLFALGRAESWRKRVVATCISGISLCLSCLPYLYYSKDKSLSAYGGTRFYTDSGLIRATAPGSGDPVPIYPALGGFHESVGQLLSSTWYYFFGAYTGVLIFAPAALLILVAACCTRGNRRAVLPWVLGIGLMIVAYIIYQPHNYFGGEQSVGNRWFVKALPLALSTAVMAPLRAVRAKRFSVIAIIMSGVLIYPHHLDPVHAFQRCGRSGWVQRFFPFEFNQTLLLHAVAPDNNPLNLSYWPRWPNWRRAIPFDPQLWIWNGGGIAVAPCSVLNDIEYDKVAYKKPFALFEQSNAGTIYISYHLGLAGNFVSSGSHTSLLVSRPSSDLEMCVVPVGDISEVTVSVGGTTKRVTLPVILKFISSSNAPADFQKIELIANGYFWMLHTSECQPERLTTCPIELK